MRATVFIPILVLALFPSPVAAQEEDDRVVDVRVVSPAPDTVVSEQVTVHGKASSPTGIKRVELFVDDELIYKTDVSEFRREVHAVTAWDTYFLPNSEEVTPNGPYKVAVRGVANGENNAEKRSIIVTVDNAPVSPTDLKLSVDDGNVSLTWTPNPEPDLTGYVVQRTSGDGFETVAAPGVNLFSEAPGKGRHEYRVFAVRKSPTVSEGRASRPSETLGVEVFVSKKEAEDIDSDSPGAGDAGSVKGALAGLDLSDLPDLPNLPGGRPLAAGDESFERRLPYRVPKEFRLLNSGGEDDRRSWWRMVPPDGLRWVAAGLLLLVAAGQSRFIATRLGRSESPAD
ncbi:MAG: Ig-like domain-containing protein [Actinomycetota bacterium]|nr:Ig-like domain-containing protein [Actinomycetota bacterium]